MSTPSSEDKISKTTPGPYDVLLGRGTGPNEHIGNIRFRARVRELIEQVSVNELVSGGLTKIRLAKQVVDEVAEKGGVFLKKAPSSLGRGGDESKDSFIEVGRTIAFDKTKQSFRHQLRSILRRRNVKKNAGED